jgi:hypothetical protein
MELQELIARVEREALADTPLARIACAGMVSAELAAVGDRVVDHFVDAARREGCSWAQIGSALGVTRQAAHQRHGSLVRRLAKTRGRRSPAITRFGPDARRAVVEAQNAARALGSHHVDTEHLLVGILRAPPGAPTAKILGELGLGPELVEEIVSTAGDDAATTAGRIPFAPAAKKVLELSLREALALRDTRIESTHLLLALLRERKSAAARLLARHGVDRARVLAVLGDPHTGA